MTTVATSSPPNCKEVTHSMSNDNAKMGQGLDIDVPFVGIVGKVRVSHTQFMFFCFLLIRVAIYDSRAPCNSCNLADGNP